MNDSVDETVEDAGKCSAVNSDGLSCQKRLYHAVNGEYWDHTGGHMYATPETMERLRTQHYDATAALKGQPFSFHSPEECTYEGACAWRKNDLR